MEEQKQLFHEVNEGYTMLEAINEAKRMPALQGSAMPEGLPDKPRHSRLDS